MPDHNKPPMNMFDGSENDGTMNDEILWCQKYNNDYPIGWGMYVLVRRLLVPARDDIYGTAIYFSQENIPSLAAYPLSLFRMHTPGVENNHTLAPFVREILAIHLREKTAQKLLLARRGVL